MRTAQKYHPPRPLPPLHIFLQERETDGRASSLYCKRTTPLNLLMSLVKDSSAHFVSWNTKLSSETFKLPSERLCRLCQLDDQTAWYVSTVSELLAAANPWFVMLGVWRRHVVMLARNGSSAQAGHILWV